MQGSGDGGKSASRWHGVSVPGFRRGQDENWLPSRYFCVVAAVGAPA